MTFFRIFKHLLPNARAWRVTIEKQLREFFEGLSTIGTDLKEFFDLIWSDINPALTRELTEWENQFGLPDTGLSESERRTRLDAAWKSLGGQDPGYIQDTLQNNGFDVYVHEWWVPGTEPAIGTKADVTARDASTLLVAPAYPLVNIVRQTIPNYIVLAGEAGAQAGEPDAQAGNYNGFTETRRQYSVPFDSDLWHYFIYIGGETFGTFASVDVTRKDEFEALCLKICPCQLWLGMFVQYV